MIIVLFILLIGLTIGLLFIKEKFPYSYGVEAFTIVGVIVNIFLGITLFIVLSCFLYDVSCGRVINSKITMYQEENTKIESSMDLLVKKYMDYESSTYSNFKPEEMVSLISLYPELKSDSLVQEQMKVYSENNNKIKELKSKQIDVSIAKWWVYFGI